MIDERKLTRYIKTEINPYGKPFDGTVFEFGNMLIDYMERMEKEPERKKGQWIILSSNEDSAVCKCSVCGEDFVFYDGEFFPNYCGDCGSDMREVRQNERF